MGKNKQRKDPGVPDHFRGLRLDDFQVESMFYLHREQSVIVCAPTGTGKTLIADYLVDLVLQHEQRLVYTGPIKALVNQKYREFVKRLGKLQVGIQTGDISENPEAPILVMTTEVLRNMLVQQDRLADDTTWVVFDELHYLDHLERGTVWEETLLFLPEGMHFLGLSATVPKAAEVAAWIGRFRQERVAVVHHEERTVPLEHLYFNRTCQAVDREGLLKAYAGQAYAQDDTWDFKGGTLSLDEVWCRKQPTVERDETDHRDLVRYLARQGLFPCLYFVLSRRGCDEKAAELVRNADYLNAREKEAVRVTVKQTLSWFQIKSEEIPKYADLREMWGRGVAAHHAGLLPVVKGIVEALLERRLIKVLYTTETFAVGVNMPVRTVCFDSSQKYDGTEFRQLTQQEYMQMAGRAGRRGTDRLGTAITRVDFGDLKRQTPPDWTRGKLEPVISRMSLSFNMTVNLAAVYGDQEVAQFFTRGLGAFQQEGTNYSAELFADYLRRKEILKELQYIGTEGLLPRGEACRKIHVQEVLVTEALFAGMFHRLPLEDLAGLAAAIVYEPRHDDPPFAFSPPQWLGEVGMLINRLVGFSDGKSPLAETLVYPQAAVLLIGWAKGESLEDLLDGGKMSEGDFVSLCRRAIDLLRQIGQATKKDLLVQEKLRLAIDRIDRSIVEVRL